MVQWKRVQLGTMGPHSVGWGSGVAMSCGVGHTRGAGLTLLWLCCRLAAVALTGPLAWEPLYAVGAALKRQKEKEKKKNKCSQCIRNIKRKPFLKNADGVEKRAWETAQVVKRNICSVSRWVSNSGADY